MECRFVYPDGQHCRCAATDRHVFCRHHAPQPRVPTLRNRAVPFRTWIDLRRALPTLDREEIPPAVLFLLSLLLQETPRRITDRNAGELLRWMLRRYGSAPFTLPDDPPRQPDPAYALSQALDRVADIIRRPRPHLPDGSTNPPMPRITSQGYLRR